ncbi:MAG: bifunctional DNA-formamidopyrimidine glycosylase/DNA-(apurinic or apyrimidinic site) lyase [Alcanivoracaceae bacterium]|nr:bifunctional DNA-formamidopyrimidine glycosylase/DNA-(apurinic or apyrimidinic site) lyase [Alcanivoracaceae bacterium]
MPELPEVETTCRGIAPHLEGVSIVRVQVRQPQLRWPVPAEVINLRRTPVKSVRRRAKFLLIDLPAGQMLIHLGMSGSLRVLPKGTPAGKHDHVDIELSSGQLLRLNDPRRFGSVLWTATPDHHPLLDHLGPEPLGPDFDGAWLAARAAGRKQSVKTFIMDNHTVVGVGNIYAQESLFLAGIHPSRQAGRVSRARYDRLAQSIREVLVRAIQAGGTTLRDFTRADGQPGYFAQALSVYGRGGEPCAVCGIRLRATRHGQRATCYCPECQR